MPTFPIELLTTAAECDAVLDAAQNELRDLGVRETVLTAQGDRTSESAANSTADLAAQKAIIDALTPVIDTLPAGSRTRLSTEANLRRATQRRDNLLAGQQVYGAIAALNRALDLRQVQAQITEVNLFITEVTTRKAAL
ncbi:hypothetical protein FY528_01315 [Hymenobacter lutimineralis]|uniref:Uncharacterized protein n=1 Tax=Hymenobacter lutimineralis TaxID=2606448 RepID=A0A5D6VGJ3_9BACT|nr:hypothetical protein [Hymenobacter lutimineralis]TYZ14397.1 hypothetical protein FY528_01315 [Hymenobacter lutimineralis]